MKQMLVVLLLGASCLHAEPGMTVSLPNGVSMDLVWIALGTFTMGSPEAEEGRGPDEGPLHLVTITRGFWLGKYEVTQEQWQAVMGEAPWVGQKRVQEGSRLPAVYISWEDAQTLIGRLNAAAGRPLYRLPTEAEWEYACRAGTQTRWSFGEAESQLGQYAWFRGNAAPAGQATAQPVGARLPNPWGVYDMHGNVWEWCQDWHGFYNRDVYHFHADQPDPDPAGPPTGSYRVLRGGGSGYGPEAVRSASRIGALPGSRTDYVGVRLVKTE